MSASPDRLLVLWDIDHTLVDTGGVGRQLYLDTFREVTGRHVEREADVTGKTETAIFDATLRLNGLARDDGLAARYQVGLARAYEANLTRLRELGGSLPGATDALASLAARAGLVQSVLTGNLRAVALIKLQAFGLDQYIDTNVGAFGEDDIDRARLVPIAQDRASAKYGVSFHCGNTVVIGDSVSDVQAAQAGGAQVIAVSTGRDTAVQLQEAGAATILADLFAAERAVERLRRSSSA